MSWRSVLVAGIVCIGALGGCRTQTPVLHSQWQAAPVQDSLANTGWGTTGGCYQDRMRHLSMTVTNDAYNLYLVIRFAAEPYQTQVLRDGGTLWLSTNGKRKKTAGIRYPLAEKKYPDRAGLTRDKRLRQTHSQLAARKNKLKLVNLLVRGEVILVHLNPGGINALVCTEGNDLIYKASIPLSLLETNGKAGMGTSRALPLLIGYQTGRHPVRFRKPAAKRFTLWIPVQLAVAE